MSLEVNGKSAVSHSIEDASEHALSLYGATPGWSGLASHFGSATQGKQLYKEPACICYAHGRVDRVIHLQQGLWFESPCLVLTSGTNLVCSMYIAPVRPATIDI